MGCNYLSLPKHQRCNRWSLEMDKWFHPTLYNGCNHLSLPGLKWIHVNERDPWWEKLIYIINNRSLFDTLTNGLAIKGIRALLQMILTNLSGIRQCGIEKVGKYLVGNYKCNIIQFYIITYRRYKYRSKYFLLFDDQTLSCDYSYMVCMYMTQFCKTHFPL